MDVEGEEAKAKAAPPPGATVPPIGKIRTLPTTRFGLGPSAPGLSGTTNSGQSPVRARSLMLRPKSTYIYSPSALYSDSHLLFPFLYVSDIFVPCLGRNLLLDGVPSGFLDFRRLFYLRLS